MYDDIVDSNANDTLNMYLNEKTHANNNMNEK